MPKDSTGAKPHTAAREAELLALMDEMRPGLTAVTDAKALVKKANDAYAVIRNKADLLGFPLALLDKALKLEREPKNRRGQQVMANDEYFIMKTLGLPVAVPQGTLDFGSDEERDTAYWGDQGYQAGIRGDIAKPPGECPTHLHQVWLNRRADGAEYSSWAKSEAGGKPDQVGSGTATTVDAERAAAVGAAPKDEPPDDEAKTAKGRPKGALARDPLLEGASAH